MKTRAEIFSRLVTNIEPRLGRPTCLYVSNIGETESENITDFLYLLDAFEVFVVGQPCCAIESYIRGDKHLIAGPPTSQSRWPDLEFILESAANIDNRDVLIRTLDKFEAAYKRAFNFELDALQEIRSLAPSTMRSSGFFEFDIIVIDGEYLFTECILSKLVATAAVMLIGSRKSVYGPRLNLLLSSQVEYSQVVYEESNDVTIFENRNRGLPIHFLTIVLNGEPFIRYHEKLLSTLPFQWTWHVVEGLADLVPGSSWNLTRGGAVPANLRNRALSDDGTSVYLDELAARFPSNVRVYRKQPGELWAGKLEMVNAPLNNIAEECLLWQIDSDELWSREAVLGVRDQFRKNDAKTAAFFWCNFFVGPSHGVSTRYNYSQNPDQEWLRVWRFAPGMAWSSHAPPILITKDEVTGVELDVGRINPFTQDETERFGAVFDHFAYAVDAQVAFKEIYYGYPGATQGWDRLQHVSKSEHLKSYFEWVDDDTMFDTVQRLRWSPLAEYNQAGCSWTFRTVRPNRASSAPNGFGRPRIVIDGIFFQIAKSGIARYWRSFLEKIIELGLAADYVLLDRGGSAPKIDGLIYRSIKSHDLDNFLADAEYLQTVCDQESATVFISSYYTMPTRTPTVFMCYDMIPELIGKSLDQKWWRQKRRAIEFAVGWVAISENSASDLVAIFPTINRKNILVAHCYPDRTFKPYPANDRPPARDLIGSDREYLILVGDRVGWQGYKNSTILYAALSSIDPANRPLLVCVGGGDELEDVGKALLKHGDFIVTKLSDEELRAAYAGALALVCPSLFEGFGLPIVEAMAVGCPVIASNSSAVPEVGGTAAFYFDARSQESLVTAIESVRDSDRREVLINRGFSRAARFDGYEIATRLDCFLRSVSDEVVKRSAETARSFLDTFAAEELIVKSAGISSSKSGPKNLMLQAEREPSIGDMLRSIVVNGLHDLEGPYPNLGITRPFRWQTEYRSEFRFYLSKEFRFQIFLEFANIVPDQQVTIRVNDALVGRCLPEAGGLGIATVFAVETTLPAGWNTLHIIAAEVITAEGRALFLALFQLKLVTSQDADDQGFELVLLR